MGYSTTITIITHSLLQPLTNFILSNLIMRPSFSHTHTHTRRSNDDEYFHASPSLVLLPPHLTTKSINMERLPIVEYATFRSHDEDGCRCAVCLSRIEACDNVRALSNCKHAFHVGCLDSWIDRGGATCPVCRAPLDPVDDEEVSHGKDPWRSQRMVYLFGEDCFMDDLNSMR